jgi:1,4-alpha-glucan branching enzyme
LFEAEAGTFLEFTRSYRKFGLNINKDGDLEYREWAPNAKELSIVSNYAENDDRHIVW